MSEIIATAPCPHCGSMQYFDAETMGENVDCRSCGLSFGAPKFAGDPPSKVPWMNAEQSPPKITKAQVEPITVKEYQSSIRGKTRFNAARGVTRITTIVGAFSVPIVVLFAVFNDPDFHEISGTTWGKWILSSGLILLMELILWSAYQFSVVIFDMADALFDIGRQLRK